MAVASGVPSALSILVVAIIAVRASAVTHFLLTGLSQGKVGSRRKGLKVTLRWEKERWADITSIHVNKLARICVLNTLR